MNNKSYSQIFLREFGITILSVTTFLCLFTYIVYSYNFEEAKSKEIAKIENNILETANTKLANVEHIIKTLSQNSLIHNYFTDNIKFTDLIEKLTIEGSVFELDEIAFGYIDGSNCKDYNLVTFSENGNSCSNMNDMNLPFNQWTNHETNETNSFHFKTYVRSEEKNEIIGTITGTILINNSSRSVRRLFGNKNDEVHLTTKNTIVSGGKVKTTHFNNINTKNPIVTFSFILPNVKGPQTIYKIAIDSNHFNYLISTFEYILICAIAIIFIFIQAFISYSNIMRNLDKESLFKLANGIPLNSTDLKKCPSEIYLIEQAFNNLRDKIIKMDSEIQGNSENLKIQQNVIQREFSERVQIIQRISKQSYIDRENTLNRLKQSVRSNVNAAHIKIDSLHDDLIEMNASYESMDKLDETNSIVDHIGQDILTEVDNLNPFTLRNQKVREAINTSDIAIALRNKGFTLNINQGDSSCSVNVEIKNLLHKTITDVFMFLLEETIDPDVINLNLEVIKEKFVSLRINTNCSIKESMTGGKFYHLEMAKERVSMFGINCDIVIVPTFSFSLMYIEYDQRLEEQPSLFEG